MYGHSHSVSNPWDGAVKKSCIGKKNEEADETEEEKE